MSLGRRSFLGGAAASALTLAAWLARGSAATSPQDATASPTRWALVLDPLKCSKADGCTDCIAACEKAHNVPHLPNPAHEVKWVWREPFAKVFPGQTGEYTQENLRDRRVLVLCNHCDNPPCVRVCPTQATWKRADGIVMMDWHRCIGCRYCVAGCPYGSRSFNWQDPRPYLSTVNPAFPTRTKGVVEKCNLCEERLSAGQPPACVSACPEKALVFGNLLDAQSEVRSLLRTRYAIRRRPELGTGPAVYYLV